MLKNTSSTNTKEAIQKSGFKLRLTNDIYTFFLNVRNKKVRLRQWIYLHRVKTCEQCFVLQKTMFKVYFNIFSMVSLRGSHGCELFALLRFSYTTFELLD